MPPQLEQTLRSPRFPGIFVTAMLVVAGLEMLASQNARPGSPPTTIPTRVEVPAQQPDPVTEIEEPAALPEARPKTVPAPKVESEPAPAKTAPREPSITEPGVAKPEPEADSGASGDEATVFTGKAVVTAQNLNLRTLPATEAAVVTTMPRGTRLDTGRVLGDWIWVRTPAGETGWVHRGYISGDQRLPLTNPELANDGDRAAIIQSIIALSVAAYRPECPCPYSVDQSGNQCGSNSAYSRGLGGAPLCYEGDVTDEMIQAYWF